MKINYEKNTNVTTIGKLKDGDCFITDDGNVYMRTAEEPFLAEDKDSRGSNAPFWKYCIINLTNGFLYWMDEDTPIIFVDAKLSITSPNINFN